MAVGTPSGRTITASVTSTGGGVVTQNVAAVSTTSIIVGVGVGPGNDRNLELVGVKLPTAAGASGPTTDLILSWHVLGPSGAVYLSTVSVQEVSTA